ncbi:uncharacterized protein LOC143882748 [Tasmannia lanceolata]|uniref:uncharacterized protein LOC143882748 n=1 Tax=Tasmannia lanceolata TaxID=3420 RepID=UPI0040630AA6
MEPKIAGHMLFLPTSRAVWLRAETLYSGTNNLTRICDVYIGFFSAKRGERSVSEYYSDFVGLCEQIDIYHPPSTDLAVLAQQKNELRVVRFLDGLSRDFLPIRQQILGRGTLPDMDAVFSRVQRALRVEDHGDTIGEQSAMAVQLGYSRGTRGRGRGRRGRSRGFGRDSGGRSTGGRGNRYCSHCDMEGHTIDFCYNLHPELRPSRTAHHVLGTPSETPTDPSDTLVVSRTEYEALLRLRDNGK